jgi:hypothetical protein
MDREMKGWNDEVKERCRDIKMKGWKNIGMQI